MKYKHLEGAEYLYGECPICGDMCQPWYDRLDDTSYESVACANCEIYWTLHHDDLNAPRDDSEPWRKYRISDVDDY